jgi:hypothetical protein
MVFDRVGLVNREIIISVVLAGDLVDKPSAGGETTSER